MINIPANELNAIQELSNALLFGGPWFVASETNAWGFDVADPPKTEALVQMLFPFKALSEPLAQQLNGIYEAELPTNPDCATFFCTGVFELLHGWFKVPLSQLMSGYYFDPSSPGSVDPGGAVDGEFGFPGTQSIDGLHDLYPWAGTTFTLNLLEPFREFWQSLLAPPSATPIEPLPNVFQVLSDLLKGIFVALDPFLPGGPFDPPDAGPLMDLAAGIDLPAMDLPAMGLTAGVDLPAEASTVLSGLDVSEPLIGSLAADMGTILPDHLGSMLASLF
ncbi:hypothetical protein [Mycobacterium sp.]|uniref:hypothetical protein n=1 Tax=Mycobacterium sp. TaxID=1785 RepID=UPI003BB10B16